MFQLDDSISLHEKWLFHQTSIYKGLALGFQVIIHPETELQTLRAIMLWRDPSTPIENQLTRKAWGNPQKKLRKRRQSFRRSGPPLGDSLPSCEAFTLKGFIRHGNEGWQVDRNTAQLCKLFVGAPFWRLFWAQKCIIHKPSRRSETASSEVCTKVFDLELHRWSFVIIRLSMKQVKDAPIFEVKRIYRDQVGPKVHVETSSYVHLHAHI